MKSPRLPTKYVPPACCCSALVALWTATSGCSFLGKQVAVNTVNSCIENSCESEQNKARQQCIASCQQEYGR